MIDIKTLSSRTILFGIVILGALLYLPFLHQVHLFDWDEINFAEAAREMLVTQNYSQVQINFEPFWEKPPLFFWMQAISMNLFGVTEFAARFPNAICGIVSLLVLFKIGERVQSKSFGIWWVILYASSLLPLLYFRSGIIDPWFNLFIFTGIYFAFEHIEQGKFQSKKSASWIILSGIAIGLGVMTKGPVALLIFIITFGALWIVSEFKKLFSIKDLFLFSITFAITGSIWFVTEYLSGRGYIIAEFFEYQIRLMQTQDAGHGGPFFYHWIVLLIGCFPLSAFALFALFSNSDTKKSGSFQRLMFILFWLVLLIFSIVKTKIIHYSSFCYLPLSYFAAVGLSRFLKQRTESKSFKFIAFALGTFWLLAMIALPLVGFNTDLLVNSDLNNDEFAKENFRAVVQWDYYHFGAAIIMLLAIIVFIWMKISEQKYLIFLGLNSAAFTLLMVMIVPNIEGYTQRAAIEFYESKVDVDCYIDTYNFKSYADLFYCKKPKPEHAEHSNLTWLLKGDCPKPVFIVMKITSKESFELDNPDFELIKVKNGFAFYKR